MLCSVCGKDHPVDDIEKTFRLPDVVFQIPEDERENRVKVNSNFCALDDSRVFVRGLIPVPVKGKDEPYCWGVWAEVAWDTYSQLYNTWDDDDCSMFEDLKGLVANALPTYEDTIDLPVRIVRQPDTRPFFFVIRNHSLKQDQEEGISADLPIHYAHL
jgi:hypothetical protein